MIKKRDKRKKAKKKATQKMIRNFNKMLSN